ncbi:MAG: UDP-D-galactose:(glucosyl)lipopolysaccharide-1,6-D-galactosyltransferase [Methanosaeta sp. PtaB.Bin018]|jgi:glycosyltransferase involved in cell wall biosynthesis|nr:glycosyltransferase family 4 protein [Methanothrix sp.]OPX76563.1 MAG: UDP-D-galactose:(glucosyl)lipopolysaccharide-1,6-D-galactosyltransferase [Methanosaeta sp. PtaB.Bin018]OPY44031.1 MAG: UDP-D-galactose:(glucosyl)lipopolysaccharide-1,6-D-galactosyltransferase [Methanosaeta sp. PtaU1.Bin016]
MRIAYIYDAVYPWIKGGAEKRIYELSRRLSARGHEVHCYGMKWWPGDGELQRDGVCLHGICKPMPLYHEGKRSLWQAACFARKVLSIKSNFDVIDCQNFPYLPCFSSKLLCSSLRSELFITWLEVWGDYWYEYLGKKGFIGRSIEWAAANLTDRNIAISTRTMRDLKEIGAREVQIVPGGIDLKGLERVPASSKESDVIYVGRLVEHKNVDLLIKAIGIAKEDIPDIRVIVVGDGPERGRLAALVRELGLEKNVKFTGFLEDHDEALAIMKSSRAFVSPSTREGFGMAALEALACGLPVVTVNHKMNAVSDLITEETGVVCEHSCDALAEAVIETLQKSGKMSGSCKELARRYDWDAICDKAEWVYSEWM